MYIFPEAKLQLAWEHGRHACCLEIGLAKNQWYLELTPEDIQAAIEQAETDLLAGKITVDTVFK